MNDLNKEITASVVIPHIGKDVKLSYSKLEVLGGGKSNEMQGKIKKFVKDMTVTIIGPGDYERETRKILGQEEFTSQPRKWGTFNSDKLIEHNGELYIEAIVLSQGSTSYELSGNPIDKQDIKGLKPSAPRDPNKPLVITLKLSSIDDITPL